MIRLLCARYHHLALIAAWRAHPELRGEPVVVGGRPELRLPVLAASPAALASGVSVGQQLRQAQQHCPAAVFVTVDADAVERLRAALLDRLLTVVPGVEVGDGEAFCDLSGAHAAHRGEPSWAGAAGRAVGSVLGDPPALGIAGSRFAARMAAAAAVPGRMRLVPEGGEAGFVAELPIGLLPMEARVLQRLAALGLDTLGAVAALPPSDLVRQFGPAGRQLHALARGAGEDGVAAWRPPSALAERIAFDPPVSDLEMVRRAAHRCCDGLGERLRHRALGAGTLGITVELEGLAPLQCSRVLPGPAGNAAELWPAVIGLLGSSHLAAPVQAVRLEVGGLSAGAGRQVDLLRSGDAGIDAVARTVMRLRDRHGAASVQRPALAEDPGDLPERRFTWRDPVLITAAAVPSRQGMRRRAVALHAMPPVKR